MWRMAHMHRVLHSACTPSARLRHSGSEVEMWRCTSEGLHCTKKASPKRAKRIVFSSPGSRLSSPDTTHRRFSSSICQCGFGSLAWREKRIPGVLYNFFKVQFQAIDLCRSCTVGKANSAVFQAWLRFVETTACQYILSLY